MVELTRWLFERYRLTYHEEAHAPILHVLATKWRGGGNEIPVVVAPGGIWDGARDVLKNLDARSRPGERLFGEEAAERTANQELIERLLDRLLTTVRRFVYFEMLPFKKVLYPIAVDGAPWWERGFVFFLYPVWRRLMGRGLGFTSELLVAAPRQIREACDIVEDELQRRRSPFLGGSKPGGVDIVFAALMAPIVMPPGYGAKLPASSELSPALARFAGEISARPAGRLVLETYAKARPPSQPPMAARGSGRTLSALLFQGPTLQRVAARIAAAYGSVLKIGRFALVSRGTDVQDVLRRDLDFRIAPVNGPRIEEVSGKFLLGLDRGGQMARERSPLYAAVSAIDLDAVRTLVAEEAERLLDDAIAMHGRIDVVNGYARLVAARTASRIFGIAGPTEMDLMRVGRAIFQHTFLNLGADAAVRDRALSAAQELHQWCTDEIERRHYCKNPLDDVIGRLLTPPASSPMALDDDAVRRNVSGLLVGAIDTTASAVGKIVAMASADPVLLQRMTRDLDNPARMIGWCNELLRLWTHNPILLRKVQAEVSLGGTTIPAGSTVIAFTHAAMFDSSRFVDPGHMNPDRASSLYWHFGGDLHLCAGRAVNDVQIPELVGRLLRRGITRADRPRYDGPFIDELVVSLRKEHS